jgi:hypothetical protein
MAALSEIFSLVGQKAVEVRKAVIRIEHTQTPEEALQAHIDKMEEINSRQGEILEDISQGNIWKGILFELDQAVADRIDQMVTGPLQGKELVIFNGAVRKPLSPQKV